MGLFLRPNYALKHLLTRLSTCFLCLFAVPGMILPKANPALIQDAIPALGSKNPAAIFANPKVEIQVEELNCPVWGYCDQIPVLDFRLTSSNDDEAQYILYVLIDDKLYEFPGSHAQISVEETPGEGAKVTYWAESTTSAFALSDNSFRMRYVPSGSEHIFQLLGEQWVDEIPGGALVWDMFPPMDLIEYGWAEQIKEADDLYTDIDYTLLAGRLIWEGIVLPGDCPNRGLLANGAADTCGMEAARERVVDWQNKHNEDILEAAIHAHVPARLLKGVIAQESQFYAKWEKPDEYGLGMLTERGVDMLLQWNEDYFMAKCGPIFGTDYCRIGYLNLKDEQQAVLIGYIMQYIGTEKEYQVLAEALYASCYQANYIVSYYTDLKPNQVADYETMWRIALGIYHAGFGCMSDGVSAGWGGGAERLEWNNILPYLIGDCVSAADYFDKVANYSE